MGKPSGDGQVNDGGSHEGGVDRGSPSTPPRVCGLGGTRYLRIRRR